MSSEGSGRGTDVNVLYERYPYPSPLSDSQPIFDTALGLDFVVRDMAGKKVLDAGCGSGHRLIGIALQFPDTSFTGVDFSARSLSIAEDLARQYGCDNVHFLHGEIGVEPLNEEFDVVVSTGVVHHLQDPEVGVSWLNDHVSPQGIIYTWFYHPYGEHERLLDRRLVQILSEHSDPEDPLIADLGLSLAAKRYGTVTSHTDMDPAVQEIADADAYLNPIVNAFRFTEAAELFSGKSDWVIVNGINREEVSHVINPRSWLGGEHTALSLEDLFKNERIREIFMRCGVRDQLKCVELRMRPTGFTLVAGRRDGLDSCTERVQRSAESANLIEH